MPSTTASNTLIHIHKEELREHAVAFGNISYGSDNYDILVSSTPGKSRANLGGIVFGHAGSPSIPSATQFLGRVIHNSRSKVRANHFNLSVSDRVTYWSTPKYVGTLLSIDPDNEGATVLWDGDEGPTEVGFRYLRNAQNQQ